MPSCWCKLPLLTCAIITTSRQSCWERAMTSSHVCVLHEVIWMHNHLKLNIGILSSCGFLFFQIGTDLGVGGWS